MNYNSSPIWSRCLNIYIIKDKLKYIAENYIRVHSRQLYNMDNKLLTIKEKAERIHFRHIVHTYNSLSFRC